MTDMYWSVGLGKSRGDKISFKILHDSGNENLDVKKLHKYNNLKL